MVIALVATYAVRERSVDIEVELGNSDEDIEIYEYINNEEDYSIHNDDQTLPSYLNEVDRSDSFENGDESNKNYKRKPIRAKLFKVGIRKPSTNKINTEHKYKKSINYK